MAIRRGRKLTRFRFLRVLRQLQAVSPAELAGATARCIAGARHLWEQGEQVMGLECLIINLNEIAFTTTGAITAELVWLVQRLGLDDDYRTLAEGLADCSDQ